MLERRRHFERSESANVAFTNPQFGGMGACNLVLVRLRIFDEFDRQLQLAKRLQRGILQILAHFLDVILIFLAEKAIPNQVHFHAFRVGEPPQRAAEDNPVEPRQGPLNL